MCLPRFSCVAAFALWFLGALWSSDELKGSEPEVATILNPDDEPCRAHNPHLESLETYAKSLKEPAFVQKQKWTRSILPLIPEDDDVRQRTEAFSTVTIRYFDLRYALIFCTTAVGRYSTQVGALVCMTWKDDHWTCVDAKCIRVYGKDISISLEDAEYHKWWHADGPSNQSRVGRKFILSTEEGGAVGEHISTTYLFNERGKLVEYTRPFETSRHHR